MNITKDVIDDLFPLYATNECSSDTRALVEEYLKCNPQHARQLQRIANTQLSPGPLPTPRLDEARSLREARRRLRRRSWLLGFAIFFSLVPFSYFGSSDNSWWMLRDAPGSALVYGVLGILGWLLYAIEWRRSKSLLAQR